MRTRTRGTHGARGAGGVLFAALLWSGRGGAVTNGAPDTGDPAVVGIVDATGRLTCTGALVAPHIVLTAAHCTQPTLKGAAVVFGASASEPAAVIAVSDAIAHPSFDPSSLADDVAILVLSSASPAATLPMAQSGPGPSFVGSGVAIVGYGETSGGAGDTGTKRRGTALVSALSAGTFDVVPGPSQPCEGDSGGPAIADVGGADTVVGVTSHGDGACMQQAVETRVDAYASFLAQAIASVGEGTAPPGARCLYPEQCSGGASECLAAPDDPSVRYCSRPCTQDAGCPAGMSCWFSQCRYPVPTPGALGSHCASDGDCIDGRCTTAGACSVRCDPAAAAPCPSGFQCVDIGEIDFACVAPPLSPPTASGAVCDLEPAHAAGSGPAAAISAVVLGLASATRRRRARRRASAPVRWSA